MKDFYTTAEIGERMGVHARHVTFLIKQGRLPFIRNGRRIAIPRPAWEEFVACKSAEALAALKDRSAGADSGPMRPK